MKILSILLVITLVFSSNANSQRTELRKVFDALKKEMNSKLSITDSLCPTVIDSKKFSKENPQLHLSSKELKEIKSKSKKQKGLKLDGDLFEGFNFISADLIYQGLENFNNDSVAARYLKESRPFYIVSRPIFFSGDTKAIFHLTLIGNGGFGTSYFMVKQNDGWVIQKGITYY
jgi:hypothetical protein